MVVGGCASLSVVCVVLVCEEVVHGEVCGALCGGMHGDVGVVHGLECGGVYGVVCGEVCDGLCGEVLVDEGVEKDLCPCREDCVLVCEGGEEDESGEGCFLVCGVCDDGDHCVLEFWVRDVVCRGEKGVVSESVWCEGESLVHDVENETSFVLLHVDVECVADHQDDEVDDHLVENDDDGPCCWLIF